jgi:hypothetical protein
VKSFARIACAVIVLSALSACAAGSADAQHMAQSGPVSQFLLGLWHGVIAPVTLLIEVVNQFAPHRTPWPAHMFEKDSGVIYDIGFYLGIAGGPSVIFVSGRRRRVVV